MFNYVSDFSNLAHHIITNFVINKNIAIDATLGNGFDCDFLSQKFKKVYAFDIQKNACENYIQKNIHNVEVIHDSHHNFNTYIEESVDCIIYNLGFLPGGDKTITTTEETTFDSIKAGLNMLNSGGFMLISAYRGHDAGKKEWLYISDYFSTLPKNQYGVMEHSVINRSDLAPIFYVIEKKYNI